MRVMLVTDIPDALEAMMAKLQNGGGAIDVMTVAAPEQGLVDKVQEAAPDFLLVRVAQASDFPFAELSAVTEASPTPVLMLADGVTADIMAQAAQAGVNALLPADTALAGFSAAIAWTQAQFRAAKDLRARLKEKEAKLADRIAIERAKGIVMKLKGLEEDTAYHEIRKLAMKRSLPMRVVADQIIDTASMVG